MNETLRQANGGVRPARLFTLFLKYAIICTSKLSFLFLFRLTLLKSNINIILLSSHVIQHALFFLVCCIN